MQQAGTLQDPSLVSLTQSMYPFIPTPPPGTTKCAIPECYKAVHIDDEGKVHLCCSRTHAREFEERGLSQGPASLSPSLTSPPPPLPTPSLGLSPTMKCAIIECPNARYKDESGTVHECCGLTHAMEHQRRLALMKRKSVLCAQISLPNFASACYVNITRIYTTLNHTLYTQLLQLVYIRNIDIYQIDTHTLYKCAYVHINFVLLRVDTCVSYIG